MEWSAIFKPGEMILCCSRTHSGSGIPLVLIVDECLPRKLKNLLCGVEAQTVPEAGFVGLKNGKLLAEIAGRFDVFITIDANLEYQQNLVGLKFSVVVIHAKSNRYADIALMKVEIANEVTAVVAGHVAHVPASLS